MNDVSNPYVIPMSWRNLLLVVAGGLGLWLLPWLPWASARAVPAREAGRPLPIFRYIRGARTLEGSTWSPVLMPFPTSVGFSRKAALSAMPNKSSASLLKPKVSAPLYLDLTGPAPVTSTTPFMAALGASGFEPEADAPSVLNGGFAASRGGLQVEIGETLKGRGFVAPALKKVLLNATETPVFTLAATVELDQKGFVQHLLLDQSSGLPAVDAQVIRALRAGTGTPGTGLASGRVKLYYWKTDRSE